MRQLFATCALVLFAVTAEAQSLYLKQGEHAVQASGGWSFGPASKGFESMASVGLGGRVDLGLGVGRYTYTFDDDSTSSYTEYGAGVRLFLVKEQNGAPVSLAVSAQGFVDDFGNSDSGHWGQVGTTVYKSFELSDWCSIEPFLGFGVVAESYTYGTGPAENDLYLSRDIGLHLTTRRDRPWLAQLTFLDQGFRRETYRGVRLAIIRKL